jgi:hypothetical protein
MNMADCSAWHDFAKAMGMNGESYFDPCANPAANTQVTCEPLSTTAPQFMTGIEQNWNDPFVALDASYSLPKSLAKMKRLTKLTFNGGLRGELPNLPFSQYTDGCYLAAQNAFDCDTFPASASRCLLAPGGTPPLVALVAASASR